MARSVLLLVIGGIAGVAAVSFFIDQGPEPSAPLLAPDGVPSPAIDPPLSELAAGDASSVVATANVTAARAGFYEQAVQATDALDLELMIDLAAAAPHSRSRDLELTALLARLAEIDPQRAVQFAQSSFLETRFQVQVFEALARDDWEVSLTELAGVTPPGKQREIAVSLLGVIGLDQRGVERVANALPSEERLNFEIDVLIARAEFDPIGVLQDVLALDRMTIQSYVLPKLAETVVRSDPSGALALSESIADYDLRRNYQNAVFSAWADVDPDGVFTYLSGAEPAVLAATAGAFGALARADSDRLLAMLDGFPPSVRTNGRRAVMQSIASEDPVAAISILDTMPPGQDRDSMVQTIAQAYGRQNADLAMVWAKSLSPPSEQALNSVLQGVAAVDADRAIDLFISELEQQGPADPGRASSLQASLSFSMMLSLISSNNGDVGRLADRLLDRNDPTMQPALSSAISMWTSRDSDAALSWALANADRLDENSLRSISRNIASDNPDLAMSTLDRLAPEQRAGWIEGLVSGLARTDINQAVGFLERLRGQPGYEDAYGSVAREMARTDPVAAARMASNAPTLSAMRTASFTIAREWANRDPAAAARWALDLEDAQIQTSALNNIALTWAQRDAEAAERWLYTLNSGPNRDSAANGIINASAQAGQFEPRLLEAYSSDQARQQGARNAIVQIARSDPEGAQQLLDAYITDPAIRSMTEEQIARMSGSNAILFSNFNIPLQ